MVRQQLGDAQQLICSSQNPHCHVRRLLTAGHAGGRELVMVSQRLGDAQQLVRQLARGAQHQRPRPPRPCRRAAFHLRLLQRSDLQMHEMYTEDLSIPS